VKFLVPIIDCLELAAVDRDASFGKEAHAAAEHNKPAANWRMARPLSLRKSAIVL